MKIMAVDYGDARTGIAVCDKTEFLASPVKVIEEKNFGRLLEKVAFVATQELNVEMVLIGLPKNMDGSCGPRAKLSEKFAEDLRQLIPIPVELWDERKSTAHAIGYLNEMNVRGKKRKRVVDQLAATLILENFLCYRKNKGLL